MQAMKAMLDSPSPPPPPPPSFLCPLHHHQHRRHHLHHFHHLRPNCASFPQNPEPPAAAAIPFPTHMNSEPCELKEAHYDNPTSLGIRNVRRMHMAFLHLKKLQFRFTHAGCKQIIVLDLAIQDLVSDHCVNRTLPEQTYGEIGDGVLEEEKDDEPIFASTDEWKEFFAKSEAKRKLEKQQAKKKGKDKQSQE